MRVANHEKGIWIYKTRNKNMICAQTRLRFQFAESRQNTTRTMGFQTKVTRGALVQRTCFIKKI